MKFIILGNSITHGLRVYHASVVTKPGMDYEDAKAYILNHKESLRNSTVIIIVGPIRFTKKIIAGK